MFVILFHSHEVRNIVPPSLKNNVVFETVHHVTHRMLACMKGHIVNGSDFASCAQKHTSWLAASLPVGKAHLIPRLLDSTGQREGVGDVEHSHRFEANFPNPIKEI